MKLDIINIEEEEDKANSVLTNEANIVTFPLSALDQEIIQTMQEMLYKLEGVGLAATQVNINKKIALIYIPDSAALLREDIRTYPMHTIINPEYIGIEEAPKVSDFEGCYSVKHTYGKVLRYQAIQVKYQNIIGETIEETVSGFYARVLQHEIDHLNGLLITDRLTPDCLQGTFEEMLEIRRQELPIDKQKQLDELIKDKKMSSKDKK
ncbi:MAG: peptide deformylase [Rickettsiaceae bacterium]|nr:peptide deformylase [Rickettsiaceae bacterium]MDP4832948.1 peptide deformylase [Rickettsiaceae bacterium]MDP5020764.1 peptide deformylase [Rickettsiaceae bacterium]MDP5083487.1 peptide deformylase [Rickettsiaceae bacterium]